MTVNGKKELGHYFDKNNMSRFCYPVFAKIELFKSNQLKLVNATLSLNIENNSFTV